MFAKVKISLLARYRKSKPSTDDAKRWVGKQKCNSKLRNKFTDFITKEMCLQNPWKFPAEDRGSATVLTPLCRALLSTISSINCLLMLYRWWILLLCGWGTFLYRVVVCTACQSYALFHCAECSPFSNSYYLFTLLFLSKQTRHATKTVSFYFFLFIWGCANVYRASKVCVDVCNSSCLVLQ